MSRLFGPTVRDFSKSESGREFLSRNFAFENFPSPRIPFLSVCRFNDPAMLGSAVDQLTILLIMRLNPKFQFDENILKTRIVRRNKVEKSIRSYLSNGEISDALLEYLFYFGKACQNHFSTTRSRAKINKEGLQDFASELRKIHEQAAKMNWAVQSFFHRGSLIDLENFAVSADLILDSELIEIKTVQQIQHHSEHVAQLFAYFLVSQAPLRKQQDFQINSLGIFYARQGVHLRHSVTELVRFPMGQLKRIAFDFLVKYQAWQDAHKWKDFSKSQIDHVINSHFNSMLRAVVPRPPWLEKALRHASGSKRVKIPDEFLLER